MEVLLKRHFWTLNLLGLAVIAWLVAASINAGIGVLLAKAGRGEDKTQLSAPPGETALAKRLASGRLSADSGALMAGRSPFLVEEKAPEPEPVVVEPPVGIDDGNAEKKPLELTFEVTNLPIKLLGTMVSVPAEFSSGSVEVEKTTQKIVKIGTELLGGQATVYAIRRNYLILKEGDKLTIAPLFAKEAAKGPDGQPLPTPPNGRGAPDALKPPTPQAGAQPGKAKVAGVDKLGPTSWKIDRTMVNEKLKDMNAIVRDVKAVPNYQQGKYAGVRLMGMHDGSLFKDIGFEDGDIVQAVNSDKIDSPNKALSLFDAFKNKSRLTILIERGGIARTLRYTIE